ncbi:MULTISPECIES: hypothetical protein [Carboxydocella]|nr:MULTISPECIES: hypothetical protein [Carboxydocella]AVX21449.1 hypothetical protein CFE_2306 [Carboxydocella thermautotrophica]
MLKKSWYKLLAWFSATFYFFVMTGVIISLFSPGPTEEQTMRWMHGMMSAMHNSLMGWALENHGFVSALLTKTGALVFPAIFAGAFIGAILKMRRVRKNG